MTMLAQFAAAAGGVLPAYIEDMFSTYLYTGTGATQTITNGIDLAGEGGLVWYKRRDAAQNNYLLDTARGSDYSLNSNTTNGNAFDSTRLTSFNADGFTLGSTGSSNGGTYASWTFRKQPKFFDVVTWTGDGVDGRAISHNLGSTPGCIIVKRTDSGSNWSVYHRQAGGSGAAAFWGRLNTTDADTDLESVGLSGTPATTFLVYDAGLGLDACNINGATYVAYLFAHDAGGFGLSGSENVVSCGSFTTGAYLSVTTVNLGYEPQWIMVKSTAAENWYIVDNMRGMPVSGTDASLNPNLSAAESLDYDIVNPTATGFTTIAGSSLSTSATYIYIAIRRGPMKVPTDGSTLFAVDTWGGGPPAFTSGFPVDWAIMKSITGSETGGFTRMLGATKLRLNTTDAEVAEGDGKFDYMNGWNPQTFTLSDYYSWMFRRAPSFFDEVCYTGTGVAQNVAHNLTVVPEMMIVKLRSGASSWNVYTAAMGAGNRIPLDADQAASASATVWNNQTPTASVFSVGASSATNTAGATIVAYLFATCPGVSKVGSYTGTGTTQAIACGFTAGARFVMIKRTDAAGDWYYWDSVRGINAGNDPYLLINTTAAQVTGTDYVDTSATGFELTSTAPAAINASGGSYIFLAVA